jgi:hypothetical protein
VKTQFIAQLTGTETASVCANTARTSAMAAIDVTPRLPSSAHERHYQGRAVKDLFKTSTDQQRMHRFGSKSVQPNKAKR